jgi:hypothetical protein
MSAKDKPSKGKYHLQYRPLIIITVEEFEDGTFNVDRHPYMDWDDSYQYYYDPSDEIVEGEGALPDAVWTDVNRVIDTLGIKQYYQAWTPEDEPF